MPFSPTLLPCLLLGLVTLIAFWPVRHHDFVSYDDQEYVTENGQVQAGLSWRGVAGAFGDTLSGNWHPLTVLSHMLDCQLYGLNPAGHHLTSVFLHAANTMLLFLALRRMTGIGRGREWVSGWVGEREEKIKQRVPSRPFTRPPPVSLWPGALVAALFALHPLHVESVAWVAERKDVLSGFFFMLTLWAYARYVSGVPVVRDQTSGPGLDATRNTQHPSDLRPLTSGFYWLGLLCFALGLMSKPMLVTLPFLLLLLDYWPLRRFEPADLKGQSATLRRLLVEKLPFFALSAVACVITYLAQRGGGAVAPTKLFPMELRLANALISCFRYVRKAFWPHDLAVFYPYPDGWPFWQVLGAGLFVAAVSALAMLQVRRRPYLLVGWLWFLGMLVPVIGLVQVGMQSLADRYTYLPLIGIFIMFAWLLADLTAAARPARMVRTVLAVAIVLACSGVTRRQLAHWRDTESLFRRALLVTQNNDVAHNGLGVVFLSRENIDDAIAHFQEALRIRPANVDANNNLGSAFLANGKLTEAESYLRRALELDPHRASAYNNLGLVRDRQGFATEAVALFETSLRLNPAHVNPHLNLGHLAFRQGRLTDAVTHYRAARDINPNSAEPHQHLGVALSALGRNDEALAHYWEALRLQPDSPVTHNKLGRLLLGEKKTAEAQAHFLEAIRLQPDFADAHSNLGLILAGQNKLDEAIARYREALRCETNHFTAHFNLGLALARQGRFADATTHLQQALKHGADPFATHEKLALAAMARGEVRAGIEHFRNALRLRPDAPSVLKDLAWILATDTEEQHRNGSEAVTLARRAVELTREQDAAILDTLAAAYAETGQFAEAVATAQRAADAAIAAGQKGFADQIATRLQSYQNGRAWRQR